jgi:carboxylate-amine ligase
VAHGLVALLAARHEAGEHLPVEETWQIAERRWEALRHGASGVAGERVARLLDEIETFADQDGLAHARALLAAGGPAAALREASGGDVRTGTAWLAERFLAGPAG